MGGHTEGYPFLARLAPFILPISHCCFLSVVLGFVLLIVPRSLTKSFAPIHRLQCFVVGKYYYYWQLSLEGPLFKVIGRCGKCCCRERLASIPQVPKALKVKVLGTTSLEVAWTPQLPDNPFHEEYYVISYCVVKGLGQSAGSAEADAVWTERVLRNTDYHKKEGVDGRSGERPKQVGKAERKRLNLSDLPEQTTFRFRVCGANAKRGKWTSEVIASTYAKPSKNMGLKGPLAKDAPTFAKEYTWWQTKHEVGLWVAIPAEWKAKEITVKVTHDHIKIDHESLILLAGPLGRKVKMDEVDWVIEDAGEHVEKGGKQLALTLRKDKLMELWASFIDDESNSHAKIDSSLVKLFYEGNSMNELACADLWD